MRGVWLAGVSIAVATGMGSGLGCFLTDLQRSTYLRIVALSAGVMLCAAVQGLLLPALEETNALFCSAGVFLGAAVLVGMHKGAARLLHMDADAAGLMFVLAMAMHHVPEGMAAGVSFGTGEVTETVSVCAAIALQNIPEAMMLFPVLSAYGRGRALAAAAVSGGVEILGLLAGYAAVQLTVTVMPLLLSAAAGAMLYVIFENMLADCYEQGGRQTAVGMLCGYCGMLVLSAGIAWLV